MSSCEPGRLQALPEDWQRALAIVAHPDDMEYGAGAAVARWTGQSKQVVYCMVTSGEAGIGTIEPERARRLREAEQIAAAELVGVGPGALNQADHIAVGRATVDAVRDAANRWVFTELLDEELGPWPGVRQIWAIGSPEAAHAVDITDTFDRGVASLEAHTAYLAALDDTMGHPSEFLESLARSVGTRLGTRLASSFEILVIRADRPTARMVSSRATHVFSTSSRDCRTI